jgi:two-component system, NarL family, nitrate/nitrite response regulator NarL
VIRVAVVEDQKLTREVTVERLRAHYLGSAAVDAYGSVEQMLASGQDFDVVVLDLWLRGGGAESAAAVRAAAQVGKVVVFSGQEAAESVQQAHAAGALGFVSKETSDWDAVLVTAIGQAVRGEQFMDPELAGRIGAAARRHLTPRQQEVLRLEALGRTFRQIARTLGLSEAGVRRHVEHIVEIHPDCAKQADRVRLAVELGLVSPWEDYHPAPES